MPEQDDLYGGESNTPNEPPGEKADRKEAGESGKTYLINKDVCPDMQVGDEMVVKIEAIHDGEYEVSYAPEHKDENADKGDESEGMAATASEGESGGVEADSMYG